MADYPNDTEQAAPQERIDALARADADGAAGRRASGDDSLRRLSQTLAGMEAPEAAGGM
jgi:hypothetical protein